ncbi:hypothetical protein CORC01_02241 [Colletotrichum orchidophilum]|uniref:Uncharacterized protein n=1 Tax=Colletotrichum orchidophilum TaxID=1209926 RepID=A0A1G4BML7_9PEZI|nr:uncharacterized protein CORC01_02241 [Colletotrichum orchidophilum]OHF02546.1 hypothetical protein CORC01_02241 [Colletotrichum orchidophilum]
MSAIVPSLESRRTMDSEATLVNIPDLIQPASEHGSRHQSSSYDQNYGLLDLMRILFKLTMLWTRLLLLPLFGWNVASTTLFLVMRGMPLGRQLEGFLRLSYNVTKMELSTSGLYR